MDERKQQQILEIKLEGLYTNQNNLSSVPQGSMAVADNVVVTKPGILESRRGQQVYGTTLTANADKMFTYRETLLVHTADNTLWYDSDGVGTWTAYSGSYPAPFTALRNRSVEANKNFYFTSNTGIKKLDAVTNPITFAGAPPGLGGTGTTTGSTGFFLTGTNISYQIVWGYTDANNNLIIGAPSPQIIVSNTTINISGDFAQSSNTITNCSSIVGISTGMIINSANVPNGTTVVSTNDSSIVMSANANTTVVSSETSFGFNTNVNLTFAIPKNLTSKWFYQVYRSQFSANLTSSPGVEYAQVLQNNLTSANIADGYITVLDNTPVDLVGALLYTNPSQLGAGAAQYQPPIAADMCEYQGYTFYANTVRPQSLQLTLLGAGNGTAFSYITVTGTTYSTTSITGLSATTNLRVGQLVIGSGIPANTTIVSINTGASSMIISNSATASATVSLEAEDGITIGNTTYWGSSAPTLPTQFLVTVNPTDPATAIKSTANALINAINLKSGSTINAYYQSGYIGVSGLILFESNVLGSSAFYATSTNGTSFNPTLPSSGTAISSDNQVNTNYLWYSTFSQPEAVPLTNFIPIGSADYPIKRILPLRTSVMIFKDDGIYRLFNVAPPFQVFLLDSTALLSAPETAYNFNNQIYYTSLQGECSLSDNSTPVIISIPIDNQLLPISSFQNYGPLSFACGYEDFRSYIVSTVTNSYDTTSTQTFVYNYVTNAWTRWPFNRTCSLVQVTTLNNSVLSTLYMGSDTAQIYQERKNNNSTDYADEQFTVNITGFNGYLVNLTSTSDVVIGQTLGQSNYFGVVTKINSSTQITVDAINLWSNGTAYVYNPIVNTIKWNPFTSDNPGIVKHFREIALFFRDAAFNEVNAVYSSDFSSSSIAITKSPTSQYSWGKPPWGKFPWGGKLGGMQTLRVPVSTEQSRGHWLNISLSTAQAFTSFSLQGISLIIEQVSERFR